jgi:hypothetical protein
MMASGVAINAMVMEFTPTKKEPNTKETGRMTLNQAKAQKYGLKEASM